MRWSKGDATAYDEILEMYGRPLYAYLCTLTGDQSSSTDSFFIRTFAQVLESPVDAGKPFLVRALKIFSSSVPHDYFPAVPSRSLKGVAVWPVRVMEALFLLDWNQRKMILLRDQQDLLIDEISWILNLSVEETRHQLHQARLRFRENIDRSFPDRSNP